MRELSRTAWHESGHAVAAFVFARRISRVTANLDGNGGVSCDFLRPEARTHFRRRIWRQLVEEEIVICLAGPLTEEIAAAGADDDSGSIDLQHVRGWMRELNMEPEDSALAPFAARTITLLTEPRTWRAVGQLARRLIRARKISGAEVERLCRALDVPRVGSSYSRSAVKGERIRKHYENR